MRADKNRLYNDVKALTSIRPARHYLNLQSLDKAAAYILDEFAKLGWSAEYQHYEADGRVYKNVIASYNASKKERLIIGAHYDVCGDQPGADDNASGVAGLLETARMMQEQSLKLDYRIDFVAYSLEEPPYFTTSSMGSAVHAKYLHDQRIKVKGMICYEMIGYFSDEPGSQNYPDESFRKIYPDKGNFVIIVGREGEEEFVQQAKKLMNDASPIDVQTISLPQQHPLAGLSDHRNYWKYGYKAIMIDDTSFLRNPHYHERSDTIDTLDFDKMAEVVTGVYHLAVNL
jgi:Zn-dependent M28 family amino/carboxypeptidase